MPSPPPQDGMLIREPWGGHLAGSALSWGVGAWGVLPAASPHRHVYSDVPHLAGTGASTDVCCHACAGVWEAVEMHMCVFGKI